MICKKTRAFTLIELMIYLALLAGLSLLVFGFAARTYKFVLERIYEQQIFIRGVVTGDLVRRDIQLASPWLSDWDFAKKTFKQLNMDSAGKPIDIWVGYEVTKKGLMRREGIYSVSAGLWITSSLALINAHVINIEMQPIIDAQSMVVGVTVIMKMKRIKGEVEQILNIALCNKVLL